MTVETWLMDWLALRKLEVKPRTLESYQDLVSRYIVPSIGSLEVSSVAPEDVRHLLASIVSKGYGRTAELVYVLLTSAFSDLDNSPMRKVKRPKHKQQRPQPWNDDQMRLYLSACSVHRHGLALSLALRLGLRRGEICGLRWQDIDLTNNVIHIVNQRQRLATGELVDCPPKSESSVRDIPIPADMLPALKKARGLPSAYLCSVTPSGLNAAHRKIVQELDLPPIPLHGLRHSMASASLRHGGQMRALQDILGHSSYTTTANIYTHPDNSMKLAALDAAVNVCYTVIQEIRAR